MQRLLAKSLLLVLLCLFGSRAYAQKTSNVKRKLAIAPVSLPASAPVMRADRHIAKIEATQLSKIRKLGSVSYPQSHLQKGLYLKQKGQTNEALLEFIRATQENPRDGRAFYEQALLFKQTGNIKLAKSSLEQALAVSPGNTQARRFLMQLHFESGNLIGAAAEVGKMLSLNQAAAAKPELVEAAASLSSTPAGSAGSTHYANSDTANFGNADATLAWLYQAATPTDPTQKSSQLNSALQRQAAAATAADEARRTSQVNLVLQHQIATPSALSKEPYPVNLALSHQAATATKVSKGSSRINSALQHHAVPPTETAKPSQADLSLADVMSRIGTGLGTVRQNDPVLVPQVQSEVPGQLTAGEQPSKLGEETTNRELSVNTAQPAGRAFPLTSSTTTPARTNATASAATANSILSEPLYLLSRVYSAATSAMTGLVQPVPDWVRNHLPVAEEKDSSAAESAKNQSRTAAAVDWMKDKVPFNGNKSKTSADDINEPEPGSQSVVDWMKDMIPFAKLNKNGNASNEGTESSNTITSLLKEVKEKLPFKQSTPKLPVPKATSKSTPISQFTQSVKGHMPFMSHDSASPAPQHMTVTESADNDMKKDLPPEIAKALEGKFSSQATFSVKAAEVEPSANKSDKEILLDKQLKQILATVPSPTTERETQMALASGPKYGLLTNNALTHVGVDSPLEMPDPQDSFLDKFLKQTGKTFSNLVPTINWSWPSFTSLGRPANSTAALIASVPALEPESSSSAKNAAVRKAALPTPIPLDVSRILNKLSSPDYPVAPPVLTSLSASLPLTAAPTTIDAMIPKPQAFTPVPAPMPASATAAAPGAVLPVMTPRALTTTKSTSTLEPHSKPQSLPQQLLVHVAPIVQNAIEQAEPIIKPAMDAARNLFQCISPLAIPKTGSLPEPVQTARAANVDNKVPPPVAVDRGKYSANLLIVPSTGSPVQKLDGTSAANTSAKSSAPVPVAPPPLSTKSSPALPLVVAPIITAGSLASPPLALAQAPPDTTMPEPGPVAVSIIGREVPTMTPQELKPKSGAGNAGPLSTPQTIPQQLFIQISPLVQSAIDQAQPLIKPALDAATNLIQCIPPLAIPKIGFLPEPVQASPTTNVANIVPMPVGADLEKHFSQLPIVPSTTGTVAEVAAEPAGDAPSKPPAAVPIPVLVSANLAVPPALPVAIAPAAFVYPSASSLPSPPPLPVAPATAGAAAPQPAAVSLPSSRELPTMTPQALKPKSESNNAGPLSTPQSAPQQLLLQLPPEVQKAIDQAQPLIKPTLDAAKNLFQSISPITIQRTESLPEPVQTSRATSVDNTVPLPVAAKLKKQLANLSIVPSAGTQSSELAGQSAGSARRIVDVQKSKVGVFTYMKPLIDSDRAYMLGARQVRTIQPLAEKKQETKTDPEEDPITKRMRYLLEHGTGNLRKGEAFMFSEETGEGILFLPDGSSERRKLQAAQEAEKVMRARRPDIIAPKDLQYTLSLLGKLMPPPQQETKSQEPVYGPTLEQLMNEMNQSSKGFFGWMKKSLNINN